MTKQEARTLYLAKRTAIPPADRQALTLDMLDQFQQIKFKPLHCVHVYRPIPSKGEIDTMPFVRHLEALFPDLLLAVPRVTASGTLEHIAWDSDTLFAPNTWGIPEPQEGVHVPLEQIDLVLVPLLAFDRAGHRVGYGKGMYDRFLSLCRPDAMKVGLSFFDVMELIEDSAEFDVPLNIGVTPTQLYEFV